MVQQGTSLDWVLDEWDKLICKCLTCRQVDKPTNGNFLKLI